MFFFEFKGNFYGLEITGCFALYMWFVRSGYIDCNIRRRHCYLITWSFTRCPLSLQPTSRCNSKIFIEYIVTRERAVGNLSAIEGQTADTLNSQTGLWARCRRVRLIFTKSIWWVSRPSRNAASYQPLSIFSQILFRQYKNVITVRRVVTTLIAIWLVAQSQLYLSFGCETESLSVFLVH